MVQRSERQRLSSTRRIVAIASGKGGVGKSTVAVNLATAMAQQGWRVGLLDADIHGPNVPLMLGVRRRKEAHGWQAMVPIGEMQGAGRDSHLPALERHGVQIMSIGLLLGEDQTALLDNVSVSGPLIRHLLSAVEWGELDVLFIDFPPGTSEPQATLLRTVELDGVIMVITPQDLARLDSTRALQAFRAASVPVLGIVENMSYLICPHCGERLEIFHRSDVQRAITADDVELLAEIPLDPTISEAGDIGRPIVLTHPEGPQARAFFNLGQSVASKLQLADS